MFRLADKARRVVFRPEITMLQENNVRKGFLQPDQVREVVAGLYPDPDPWSLSRVTMMGPADASLARSTT